MIILPGEMYDAIPSLVGNIPTTAYAVAGYVDSISFTWSQANWDRFPNSLHCTITTTGRLPAHFADVENGDLTPQQGYDLHQAGRIKGIYCNFATWQAVQDIFNANHKPQPPYWIAQYPGGGRVMPVLNDITAIAHQYYNSNLYDRSAITDAFVALIGGSMSFDLTTPLPDPASVAGTGTVAEALTTDLYGIGGRRNGGALSNAVAALQSGQASMSAALTALATAVAATDADVKAAATQEAADHAATLAAVAKVNTIDPAVLETDIQSALTALGWSPPPSVKDIAVADAAVVAPAVLALIASKLGGAA